MGVFLAAILLTATSAPASPQRQESEGLSFKSPQQHLVFDKMDETVIWPVTAVVSAETDDSATPELVPIPPAVIPAALVLGWVMLRKRHRRARPTSLIHMYR